MNCNTNNGCEENPQTCTEGSDCCQNTCITGQRPQCTRSRTMLLLVTLGIIGLSLASML
jgi:hypothetical protein